MIELFSNPLFYNLILILLLSVYFANSKNRINSEKHYIYASFFVLLFFRTYIDINSLPDLSSYKDSFEVLSNTPWQNVHNAWIGSKINEIGFRYFLKFGSIIGNNFHVFLIIFGVLWLYLYTSVIKRCSPIITLSFVLLLLESYNQSLFVLRQHLAMAIVFFSYQYVIDKKLIKYLIAMAIAFSIHQTAIIALPIFFIYNINSRKLLITTLLVSSAVLYYTFAYILTRVGGDILYGYDSYLLSDEGTNTTVAILNTLLYISYCFFLKKDVLKDGINKLLFVVMTIGLLLSYLGIGYNPTSRLLMYYVNTSFLSVPIIASYIQSKSLRFCFVAIILLLFFYLSFLGSSSISIQHYELL